MKEDQMYRIIKSNNVSFYSGLIILLVLLIIPVGLSASPYTDDVFKKQMIKSMYEKYEKKERSF